MKKKFCIQTLTHSFLGRGEMLTTTVDSFLENSLFPEYILSENGKIDWYVRFNGTDEELLFQFEKLKIKYNDIVNWYEYRGENLGVGAGINFLNRLTKDYEYVFFLEGDWITLPDSISGLNNWLPAVISCLEEHKDIDVIYLRKYLSDIDDRQFGYSYWIREENIKERVELDGNTFLKLVKREYSNNPHIRRNSKFFEVGIFPLEEFFDKEGKPLEIKGNDLWGQAEIKAEPVGFLVNSSYITFGNMVHIDHFYHHYNFNEIKNWESFEETTTTCGKYSTGKSGCKYGYFFPDEKFCSVCDHSKNFTHNENHLHTFIEKYYS